jgi:hypothetical protein
MGGTKCGKSVGYLQKATTNNMETNMRNMNPNTKTQNIMASLNNDKNVET